MERCLYCYKELAAFPNGNHLCTPAIFRTIYHKRKILDIRLNIKDFSSVGVTGFEPATTRPPDVYSNRTELRPDYPKPFGLGLQI